jgi:hypothetical protein
MSIGTSRRDGRRSAMCSAWYPPLPVKVRKVFKRDEMRGYFGAVLVHGKAQLLAGPAKYVLIESLYCSISIVAGYG